MNPFEMVVVIVFLAIAGGEPTQNDRDGGRREADSRDRHGGDERSPGASTEPVEVAE